MPFFGGFTQGLAGGLQAGQQMKMQAEEHKLKARMLDFQAKKMEADQQLANQKVQAGQQQQQGMEDYIRGITGQSAQQIEQPGIEGAVDQPVGNQVMGQPGYRSGPASKEEQFALSLRAVRPEDRYHLIQQQQKAELPGAANAAFADVNSALAFQNTPEFQTAFPTGARLQQTSKGWTFQGVNPVNVASNEFHRVLSQTKDPAKALEAYNSTLFGGSAMQGAGSQLGQAAATMGAPIPPPPPMTGRPQSQAPVGPQGALSLPPEQGAGGQTFRIDPNIPPAEQARIRQQMGIAQAAPTGQSLPLQAAGAKAAAGEQGKLQVHQTPEYIQNKTDVSTAEKRGTEAVAAQNRVIGIAGTAAIVNKIGALAEKLNKSQGGLDRFVQGAQNKAGALLQTNPDAAELENLRESYSNNISRSLLAERGVITDRDRNYAINAIPSIFDTKDMTQRKMFTFKTLNKIFLDGEQTIAEGKPLDVKAFRAKLDAITGAQSSPTGEAEARTTLNGKSYIKRNGQWFEE